MIMVVRKKENRPKNTQLEKLNNAMFACAFIFLIAAFIFYSI